MLIEEIILIIICLVATTACAIVASGVKTGLSGLYSLCNSVYKEGAVSFAQRTMSANFERVQPIIWANAKKYAF